jgi:hypothetical protein
MSHVDQNHDKVIRRTVQDLIFHVSYQVGQCWWRNPYRITTWTFWNFCASAGRRKRPIELSVLKARRSPRQWKATVVTATSDLHIVVSINIFLSTYSKHTKERLMQMLWWMHFEREIVNLVTVNIVDRRDVPRWETCGQSRRNCTKIARLGPITSYVNIPPVCAF